MNIFTAVKNCSMLPGRVFVMSIDIFRVLLCSNTENIVRNNNKKFRSFKSKENIHKKEVEPHHGFGYLSLISNPINLAKGARGKYREFANFNNGNRLKD